MKKNIFITLILLMGITLGMYFGTHGSPLISHSIAKEVEKSKSEVSPIDARERDYYSPK